VKLRERGDVEHTPVVILTSSWPQGAMTPEEAGVAACLAKPVSSARLREVMHDVLEAVEQTRPAPTAAPGAAPDGRRRHAVLLAEDNLVNQRVAVGLLSKRGHDVTVVGTGQAAIEAVARRAFDVVLMDVQMPEMGGFEATAIIRERERETGGHLRIVAMTAHAMKGDRERCLDAGMDDYLTKPIDPQALFAVSAFDRGSLLDRVEGDELLLAAIVKIFVADCPTGLAAVRAAVDRGDAEAIRSTAHALKGMASNLSAGPVTDAAASLEAMGREGRIENAAETCRRLEAEVARLLIELAPLAAPEPTADWAA
jgi:two-component system sensor histidine kinase/response regulator